MASRIEKQTLIALAQDVLVALSFDSSKQVLDSIRCDEKERILTDLAPREYNLIRILGVYALNLLCQRRRNGSTAKTALS